MTSLRTAVVELSASSAENPYRVAAHAVKQRFEGGGVPKAVDIILKHAACAEICMLVPTPSNETLNPCGSLVTQTRRLSIIVSQ